MGCHRAGTRPPEPLRAAFPAASRSLFPQLFPQGHRRSVGRGGGWGASGEEARGWRLGEAAPPARGSFQVGGLPGRGPRVSQGHLRLRTLQNGETGLRESRVCLHSAGYRLLVPAGLVVGIWTCPSLPGSKLSHGSPAPSEQNPHPSGAHKALLSYRDPHPRSQLPPHPYSTLVTPAFPVFLQ